MTSSAIYHFILAALAVWRVTHLLAHEDGPADLIVRLRLRLGDGLAGRLMDCFQCLSLWVAVPATFAIVRDSGDWPLTWLALSGAACLLERFRREPTATEAQNQFSQGETQHVLRSETRSAAQ